MQDARRTWVAALAFLFLSLSLVTGFAIGLAGWLCLLTALCWWRAAGRVLRRHWHAIRPVVLVFLLHATWTGVLAFSRGRGMNAVDGPLRMCLVLPAMLLVALARPPLRALWLGAAVGACAAAGFVIWQAWVLGIVRPGGLLNPITFGDLALCLALLALVGAMDAGGVDGVHGGEPVAGRCIAGLGVLAGVSASLLTGSRGGWVVVPVVVGLLALAVPQTGVRDRVAVGLADLRLVRAGAPAYTSLGVRLELWRAGLRLAGEHPWTGSDTPAYKARMRTWIAAGTLRPVVLAPPEPPHMHNDMLQALVTRGLPGLLAWLATLLAPLWFFRARLRGASSAAALAGMLLVVAYAGFGLSEVIFWSMKASVFYALTVSLLMGWCLAADAPADAPQPRSRPACSVPDTRHGPVSGNVSRAAGLTDPARASASGYGPSRPRQPSTMAQRRMRSPPRRSQPRLASHSARPNAMPVPPASAGRLA
jgi:O-antigen ligase